MERPAEVACEPRARTSLTRSTEWTTSAYLTTLALLFTCNCPTKCHRGREPSAATSVALGAASWSRFSPKSATPSPASKATSVAGNVLVMAISVTSPAGRPAAWQALAIRSSTCASRSRSWSTRAASSGHGVLIRSPAPRSPAREPDDPGEPASAAVTTVGVKVSGLSRAAPVIADQADPGVRQLLVQPGPDVDSRRALPGGAGRAGRGRVDLVPHPGRHLVAATADD